jgi:hypothetical protein
VLQYYNSKTIVGSIYLESIEPGFSANEGQFWANEGRSTMSGAVNQARRRSVDNQTVGETVTDEGWSFEVQVMDAKAIGKLK